MVPFVLFVVGWQTSREQRDPARSETSVSLHGDYLKSESAGSGQPWRRYLSGTFEFCGAFIHYIFLLYCTVVL